MLHACILFSGSTFRIDAAFREDYPTFHSLHKAKQCSVSGVVWARACLTAATMLWGPRGSSNFSVWVSHENVSSKVCPKVTTPSVFSCSTFISFASNHSCYFSCYHTLGMDSFCWRALQQKILLVFLLQFFISSTSCQRCIKSATQNCFSELARYYIDSLLMSWLSLEGATN